MSAALAIVRSLCALVPGWIWALLLLWALAGGGVQTYRLRGEQAAHAQTRAEYAEATSRGYARTIARLRENLGRKEDAIAQAALRAQVLARESADLRESVDELQLRLDLADAALDAAAPAAVRQHAATLNRLFGQCAREYQALADRADGHASDTLMLLQAWPRGDDSPDP